MRSPFLLLNFDQKYKFSNKNNMVSAWRNFRNIFPRPLFIIIFRPEMLKFHPYSILTGDTMVGFVMCPNSKEIKLQSSIRVIYTSFRSVFSLAHRRYALAERFKIQQPFQYSTPISTLRIWHDPCISKGTFYASQNR